MATGLRNCGTSQPPQRNANEKHLKVGFFFQMFIDN